jgi:hypothetical protein
MAGGFVPQFLLGGALWGAAGRCGVVWRVGVGFVLRRRDALGAGRGAARFEWCGFRVIALWVERGLDGLRRSSVERALRASEGNVHLWCTAKLGAEGRARFGRTWALGLWRMMLEAPMMIVPFSGV